MVLDNFGFLYLIFLYFNLFLDVLVKVDCVGICGSDVHYMTRGFIGDFVLKGPMIIGHEGSGVVAKVCNSNNPTFQLRPPRLLYFFHPRLVKM